MQHWLIFIVCSLSTISLGKGQGAHVHGQVRLDLAVEQKQLLVMVQAPAETFFGFEYKPKTEVEKKKVQQAQDQWQKNLSSLFEVKGLNCKVSNTKWEQEFSSASHSEIKAEGYFDCPQALSGRDLEIKLKDQFDRMLIVNYQLIRSDSSADSGNEDAKVFKVKL